MDQITLRSCEELDCTDPLAHFREKFKLPDKVIYLDGNSLGAMPRAAEQRACDVVAKEWGSGLIRSWNEAGWWELPVSLGNKIATLIGAETGEVIATDTTGINLYKVLAIALAMRPERRVIVMEGSNFPTDNYIAQGLIEQLDNHYEIRFVEEDELASAIDEEVAAVCLTQVHYRSGRMLDMKALTSLSQRAGALCIWDLCHSAGVLELELNRCKVDFAVGCTYKYLNGGPGSPAFVFVAKRHQGKAQQPLTGWWGHADPFAFEPGYRPAVDIRQLLSGTQSALAMAVAEVGVDLILQADMREIRAKSKALTTLFINLLEQRCSEYNFELQSPREASMRGSQVAIGHPHGHAIMATLIARGVIGDFRAPGTLRFGFAPLYTRYTDVWHAIKSLVQIMATQAWQQQKYQVNNAVT